MDAGAVWVRCLVLMTVLVGLGVGTLTAQHFEKPLLLFGRAFPDALFKNPFHRCAPPKD